MGKIIVTGAAGFIGSNLVQHLNNKGRYDIIAVDTLSAYKNGYISISKNLGGVEAQMTIEEFTLKCLGYLNNDLNEDFFSNIEAVFHLGAVVDTSSTDSYILDYNLTFSQILFSACSKSNIPILYASSAAVYGGSKEFNEDKENLSPMNLYGASKYLFEKYAETSNVYNLRNKLKWFGFRLFDVYGPNELHKVNMASDVTQIYVKAREGLNITLFKSEDPNIGDGYQSRDFIHVDQVVKTLYHFFINRKDIESGIYNVGSGEPTTFISVAEMAVNIIKSIHTSALIDISYIETPMRLKESYQSFMRADITKTKKVFDNEIDSAFDLMRYFHYLNKKFSINFGKDSNYTLSEFYKQLDWK